MADPIDANKIALFQSIFRSREDVYARYWVSPDAKKSGYAPIYRLNQQSAPLSADAIGGHLRGHETIGIYPLLKDNTTQFLAVDFDKGDWLQDASSLLKIARAHRLSCYIEKSRSGNGAHVWFFFMDPLPAWKARQLGKYLLNRANIKQQASFDRMFPSQDEHSGKGYGNLIALPLQGTSVTLGATVFINSDGEVYPDQWQLLESIVKITPSDIDRTLEQSKAKVQPEQPSSTELKTAEVIEDDEPLVKTSSMPTARLTLASQITIPDAFLPDSLYRFLRQKLNFSNPEFIKLQRKGYSTWQTPRTIKTLGITPEAIIIPAGFLSQIEQFASKHNLELVIDDQRLTTQSTSYNPDIALRPEQKRAAQELLQHNRVILEAKPGFGKTITALYCIAKIKQPTLIIVHTRTLMHQWRKHAVDRLGLEKNDIGVIGENKWQIGRKVTIASYQTLARRGVEDIKDSFGLVVVDECHHVPARTFTTVLKNLPAKRVIGLTATAFRRDELDRLMTFYLGPIVKASQPNAATTDNTQLSSMIPIKLIIKQTDFELAGHQPVEFHEIASQLIANSERNLIVAEDVVTALSSGGKCLVLTERIDHCETLLALIRKQHKGVRAAIAKGSGSKKEREKLAKRIRQPRFQLLIATGKLIGEGFDWPELTHLFLVFPFTWKGKLIQYIGRLQRGAGFKQEAMLYDYVDYGVPMLKLMYFKRLRAYRALGIAKAIKQSRPKQVLSNQIRLL